MWCSGVAAWCSGIGIKRINEVTLRRALLALRWVAVFGRQTTLVFHQATQANSTSYPQRDGRCVSVVTLCGWGIKIGMAHSTCG